MKNKNTQKFCNHYSFKMIFIFFIIGCLFGTFYEEILHFIIHQEFSSRQGLLYGPFNPIYGFGFASFIIFLGPNYQKRGFFKTWLLASIISGSVEFIEHFIYDKVFGIEFWNYSKYILNINGRTTIPYMVIWGLGGIFIIKVIYPLIIKLIDKIPLIISNIIYYCFFIFLILDISLTYTAFLRMSLREKNVQPLTFIGSYCDKVYTNEYLSKKFPIMKPTKKN